MRWSGGLGGRGRTMAARLRRASAMSLLILVVALLALFGSIPVSRRNDGLAEAEVIVVLGGNTKERSRACHALWRERRLPVLVTGDGGHIYRELRRLGIPAEQILHERAAVNTQENAEFSVRLLRAAGYRSAVVVTSWFHSSRAHGCFVKAAPEMSFGTFSEPAPERWTADDWKLVMLEKMKKTADAIGRGINPWGTSSLESRSSGGKSH